MPSATVQSGNTVQINFLARYDSQLCVNTFHYFADPARTAGTINMAQVLSKWEEKVWQPSVAGATDGLADMFGAGVADCKIVGQLVNGIGSRSRAEPYLLDPDTGGYPTGNPLPSGVSAVIQRVGDAAGRKFQGRFYIFGITTATVENSLLKPAYVTQLNTLCSRLDVPLTFGAGATLVTLTPCLFNGVAEPLASQQNLVHTATSVVRYQRRREVGVGQ